MAKDKDTEETKKSQALPEKHFTPRETAAEAAKTTGKDDKNAETHSAMAQGAQGSSRDPLKYDANTEAEIDEMVDKAREAHADEDADTDEVWESLKNDDNERLVYRARQRYEGKESIL